MLVESREHHAHVQRRLMRLRAGITGVYRVLGAPIPIRFPPALQVCVFGVSACLWGARQLQRGLEGGSGAFKVPVFSAQRGLQGSGQGQGLDLQVQCVGI